MNEKERKDFEKLINQELEKIKEKVADLEEITKPIAPENAIGRISRMDAINNKSVNEAALRKAIEKLKNLEYARTKVGEVSFGVCARCGNPIPNGRLLLMPESINCVQCADR